MKKTLITLSFLVLLVGVYAQNFGEIHGKVLDENGDPMISVNIFTETGSGEMSTVSDIDGKFKLKPLVSGTYTVNLTFVGYTDKVITNIPVNPDKINNIGEIQLKVGAMIGVADVEGYKDKLIDPEETSVITKRYAEIKQSPLAKTPLKYIATFPGVQEKDGQLYFRGSRTGAVQYQIDGIKMTGDVSTVPSSAIGSISVYTGGVPAKYGDTTGGVVVIETRSFMDLYYQRLFGS